MVRIGSLSRVGVAGLALALGVTAAAYGAPRSEPAVAGPTTTSERGPTLPSLRVTRTMRGLQIPWDVQQIPGGEGLLVTERSRRRLLVKDARGARALEFSRSSLWASGETGLMSLAFDPGFGSNRTFYTCHGRELAGVTDIAVVAWRLGTGRNRARFLRTVLGGIDITTGRHGGCRLLMRKSGALYVGTGDSAVGTYPQDLTSLNGKVLKLDARTGKPWPTNPFIGASNARQRYVLTYGHRNVQGLALRSDGTVWSVEHGSFRDDEVNLLVPGGNYGWDPVPGYDESGPMTDHSLPGTQIDARWSSGDPTIATSGAAWVKGSQWGDLDGTLAVATLKAERLVFMKFGRSGVLKWTRSPAVLRGTFGRLRSVTRTRSGDLLVTTSNGVDDLVLRVRPR